MTAPELVIRAIGIPAKKGSKAPKGHVRGRCILVEMDKKLPAWTKAVQTAARNAVRAGGWLLITDACEVSFVFLLPRPKTVKRELPTGRGDGDVDKMIRATLDAMTGIVYADDALVTDFGRVAQRYCKPGQAPGARIVVRAMSEVLL